MPDTTNLLDALVVAIQNLQKLTIEGGTESDGTYVNRTRVILELRKHFPEIVRQAREGMVPRTIYDRDWEAARKLEFRAWNAEAALDNARKDRQEHIDWVNGQCETLRAENARLRALCDELQAELDTQAWDAQVAERRARVEGAREALTRLVEHFQHTQHPVYVINIEVFRDRKYPALPPEREGARTSGGLQKCAKCGYAHHLTDFEFCAIHTTRPTPPVGSAGHPTIGTTPPVEGAQRCPTCGCDGQSVRSHHHAADPTARRASGREG